MFFSLLVAFIVTPWASYKLLSHQFDKGGHKEEINIKETLFWKLYSKLMVPLLVSKPKRYAFYAFTLSLMVLSVGMLLTKVVVVKMLPYDNKSELQVVIDMPEGSTLEATAAVARELALTSDVIVENFSAGVLQRWGLDRASLAPDHPGITVISMGGMGQTGPWKEFVTYAPTIHALTGLTYLTNPEGTYTDGYGFSLTDHLSGLAAALAALEGLEHRERTGQGLAIDLAQYELGLGIMGPAMIDYLANGTNPEPRGNRHPFDAWAPHGIYPCAGEDRWVAIAVRGDDEWRRLAGMLGIEPGGRFATHADRVANWRELDAAIAARTRREDPYELSERLQRAGVCAAPVQHAADLAERDPQLAARDFFGSARAEKWGEYGIDRFPARFDGERPPVYEGVRQVGEDTYEVLSTVLGYDDERIAELMAGGVLS
jgi:crotonobetainyl-CoA:carnitine CoA-transferase CaiB-like acyl-CoA transferase